MAKYEGEKKSGKIGDKIYSSWNGRPYVRQCPESVANPRTEAQQSHRNVFAEISRLSSAMKEGHKVGLHCQAEGDKLSTHCVFRKLNKDCIGPDGIDYPHVRISNGSVTNVYITAANVDVEGNVHVEFQSHFTLNDDNLDDEFYLYVFCPDQRVGRFARPVKRDDGAVSASIPVEWLGHALHLYAFMKDKKGRTSNTIYLGQF